MPGRRQRRQISGDAQPRQIPGRTGQQRTPRGTRRRRTAPRAPVVLTEHELSAEGELWFRIRGQEEAGQRALVVLEDLFGGMWRVKGFYENRGDWHATVPALQHPLAVRKPAGRGLSTERAPSGVSGGEQLDLRLEGTATALAVALEVLRHGFEVRSFTEPRRMREYVRRMLQRVTVIIAPDAGTSAVVTATAAREDREEVGRRPAYLLGPAIYATASDD